MKITCEHMGITCETHVIFMCFFRKGLFKIFQVELVEIA